VSPPDEDAPAREAIVVGPAPALGTVGDFDPAAQAATATMTATAGHSFDERITPPLA